MVNGQVHGDRSAYLPVSAGTNANHLRTEIYLLHEITTPLSPGEGPELNYISLRQAPSGVLGVKGGVEMRSGISPPFLFYNASASPDQPSLLSSNSFIWVRMGVQPPPAMVSS